MVGHDASLAAVDDDDDVVDGDVAADDGDDYVVGNGVCLIAELDHRQRSFADDGGVAVIRVVDDSLPVQLVQA